MCKSRSPALFGVSQLRKVNLLQERCSYWDTDLVPEAKSALTNNIFHLFAYNGGMDANDIVKYFDKVTNHTTLCPLQIDSQHPRPFQHYC